jgi:catechol 2,3-dioxygenase
MTAPIIAAIGHVAFQTPELSNSVEYAEEILGLRESDQAGEWTYLTHGTSHHSLQFKKGEKAALDHVGLVCADRRALAELRLRLQREGIEELTDWKLEPGIGACVAFAGPGGTVFEVYPDMACVESWSNRAVSLTRFGHVTLLSPDPQAVGSFLERVLDFRVSDIVGDGLFLRCNADHHGVGVMPGQAATLHHYAWEVASFAALGEMADLLDANGHAVLWGPVRHGAGRNIAIYFRDPCDAVIEYYVDMEQIVDEANHVPGVWDVESDHKWYSLWAPGIPPEMMDLGVPAAPAVADETPAKWAR